MSSTMRNLLGAFLRLYARREASTRLLFATPSGERHETRDARRGDAGGERRAGRLLPRRRSARPRHRRQRRSPPAPRCWCSV